MSSDYDFIEGDAIGAEQHLQLDVDATDAGGTRSYLRLGDWNPSDVAHVLASEAFVTSHDDLPSASSRGDDLLAAFLDDVYLDERRSRSTTATSTDSCGNEVSTAYAAGYTDYAHLAVQPDGPTGDALSDDGYTRPQRRTMTTSIPGFVGWRDHCEGHRITTTRGDKIEVIGGNYKLVVLGRGQGTARTDWSGGTMIDTLEAPGNVTSVNYRQMPVLVDEDGAYDLDETDTFAWQWVEETIKGHVVERFHGTMQEEMYGDKLITIVGRAPEADGSDRTATAAADDDSKGIFDEAMVYDGTVVPTWDDIPSGPSNEVKLLRPRIKERVHATELFSAEIVDGAKVDVEVAPKIHDYVGCLPDLTDPSDEHDGEPRLRTVVKDGVEVGRSVNDSDRPDEVFAYVMAKRLSTTVECNELYNLVRPADAETREEWFGNYIQHFDGTYLETFLGSSTTGGVANRFESFVGWEQQINLGAKLDFTVAFPIPKLDIFFGRAVDYGVGRKDESLFRKDVVAAAFISTAVAAVAAVPVHLAARAIGKDIAASIDFA